MKTKVVLFVSAGFALTAGVFLIRGNVARAALQRAAGTPLQFSDGTKVESLTLDQSGDFMVQIKQADGSTCYAAFGAYQVYSGAGGGSGAGVGCVH